MASLSVNGANAQMSSSILFGDLPSLLSTEETHKDNVFGIGVRVSNNFDDNALNDSRAKRANVLTIMEPHFQWSGSRSRAEWSLSYSPGYSLSHPLAVYSSQSQHFDASIQWKPLKRLKVQLQNNFLESTNPFDRLGLLETTPGATGIDQANISSATSARARSEQMALGLMYATSTHGVVGAKSSWFNVNYSGIGESQGLGSARSITEQLFYSHHLTRRQWVGLQYSLQDLNAHNPTSHALVHSLFYTHAVRLGPNMVFSWFAGPQHTAFRTDSVSAVTSSIHPRQHWAGGATYSWTWDHDSISAGFSRRITDGAGLTGIARLSTAYTELRHEITQRWSADMLVSYLQYDFQGRLGR